MVKNNTQTCTKCKTKDTETRHVHSFQVCKECFNKLPETTRKKYPVW